MYANANFREKSLGKRKGGERERGEGQTIEGKSKSKKKRSLKKGGQKKKKRYTCAMVAGKIKEYGEDAWYIL